MKQFITLICLAAVLGCGGVNEPCPQEMVQVYVKMKYIDVGEYESTYYDTYSECQLYITPNNGKPHYCKPEHVLKEVCE